jgi:hypothetical protein
MTRRTHHLILRSEAEPLVSKDTPEGARGRRRRERPSRRAFGAPQDEAEGGGTRPESTLNRGHEFGAGLTDDERWASIEYMKTL